ncbi:hypothetical protein M8818_004975 [Zalaria obscura]|uniref:Uncharacterized protein n=1 Tax=Zalaria obscura TaxID=2024903 RepID=A0ACC3SD77_9PEZI
MQKACEGLRTALADFSQENADGVLAASIMLVWQCLDSSDYVKILQGTSALFVGGAPELLKAARAMSDFVRNLRLFPPGSSSVEQYRVFTAVKTWLPWMPAACLGLGTRDLPVMVTMAHYHALSIATESYLPAAASVLFLNKRTKIIARIYAEMRVMELADLTEQCQVRMKKALDLMIVPLLYALRYTIQHGTVQYRRTLPSAAGVSLL